MASPGTPSLVALLTDFGLKDTYVGVMKGVIAGLSPGAQVLDLSHGVTRGGVPEAAFKLWQSVSYFPPETIFVVVIDPGVGTERRAIAGRWRRYWLVAPDNGVLTYLNALEPFERLVELDNPAYQLDEVSSTFHGRDIFAPAAGHLAAGVPLERLGSPVSNVAELDLPGLKAEADRLDGEIVHIDRFGNLITNLGRLYPTPTGYRLDPWLPVTEGRAYTGEAAVGLPDGRHLPLNTTFGDVPAGQPVAYLGSEALVEVAINDGSAAHEFELDVGDRIYVEIRG